MELNTLNELGESTTEDIVYGEVCYLRQGKQGKVKLIERNYPVKYCVVCNGQIFARKEKSRDGYGGYVFQSAKRFENLKTCNSAECKRALMNRPKITEAIQHTDSKNFSILTGRPVDPKIIKVHVYRSSCYF